MKPRGAYVKKIFRLNGFFGLFCESFKKIFGKSGALVPFGTKVAENNLVEKMTTDEKAKLCL